MRTTLAFIGLMIISPISCEYLFLFKYFCTSSYGLLLTRKLAYSFMIHCNSIWLDCVKHRKMAQTALSHNLSRQFPMNILNKSASRNRLNFTFMKSFSDFKSKKKSIQILIWKQVYARNFYCFNCFFPFNASFVYPFTIFVIFYFYNN